MSQVLDGSERILAIPTSELEGLRRFPGYHPSPPIDERWHHWPAGLLRSAKFLPRTEDLEHGPGGLAWLQVIPYALLVDKDKVFAYRRPSKGGDRRLAGRCSIGIGGHVNPMEGLSGDTMICGNLGRELYEEMGVACIRPRLAGLLWDDRDDVGSRHLGLVYVCEVEPGQVVPQAAEVEPLGWWTAAELRDAHPAAMWESWSAILIGSLEQILCTNSKGSNDVRTERFA